MRSVNCALAHCWSVELLCNIHDVNAILCSDWMIMVEGTSHLAGSSWDRFSKVPKRFFTQKTIAKSKAYDYRVVSGEVSAVYTCLFLDRLTENGFAGTKSFRRWLWRNGPRAGSVVQSTIKLI